MSKTTCAECRRAERAARAKQIASSIHEYNGRWIIAHWNARNVQWTGQSTTGSREMGTSYRYSFARTLAGLVSVGVPTYARRSSAVRALAPSLDLAMCPECRADLNARIAEWDREEREREERRAERLEAQEREREERQERQREAQREREAERLEAERQREADRAEALRLQQEAAREQQLLDWFWDNVRVGSTFASINGCSVASFDRAAGIVCVRTEKGALKTMRPYAWSHTIGFRRVEEPAERSSL